MLCFLLGEPQLFLRACWPVHGQQGLARERVTGKPRQGPFTFCQFFGGVESFLVAASCEQKFRPSLAIKFKKIGIGGERESFRGGTCRRIYLPNRVAAGAHPLRTLGMGPPAPTRQ